MPTCAIPHRLAAGDAARSSRSGQCCWRGSDRDCNLGRTAARSHIGQPGGTYAPFLLGGYLHRTAGARPRLLATAYYAISTATGAVAPSPEHHNCSLDRVSTRGGLVARPTNRLGMQRSENSLHTDELAQFRRPWRGEYLIRRADLVYQAVMHEDDARADVAGKAHFVRDHQ